MSKKPVVWVCTDGIRIWFTGGLLFGIHFFLLLHGDRHHGSRILVQREKIAGINLSQAHIVYQESGRSELHGSQI